ncbi:hypothetical protein BC937DRAFT_94849 [Endogone sp. FLAS-F59071]|nr:hypothetical protein BC937DRAFT_94849 [Endogone sp. FLAS-F59071]|eukprot:RUS20597.1 hypothetical protein BC937DRAFT_94849 [Endogone sp. FLAS-F59071]
MTSPRVTWAGSRYLRHGGAGSRYHRHGGGETKDRAVDWRPMRSEDNGLEGSYLVIRIGCVECTGSGNHEGVRPWLKGCQWHYLHLPPATPPPPPSARAAFLNHNPTSPAYPGTRSSAQGSSLTEKMTRLSRTTIHANVRGEHAWHSSDIGGLPLLSFPAIPDLELSQITSALLNSRGLPTSTLPHLRRVAQPVQRLVRIVLSRKI